MKKRASPEKRWLVSFESSFYSHAWHFSKYQPRLCRENGLCRHNNEIAMLPWVLGIIFRLFFAPIFFVSLFSVPAKKETHPHGTDTVDSHLLKKWHMVSPKLRNDYLCIVFLHKISLLHIRNNFYGMGFVYCYYAIQLHDPINKMVVTRTSSHTWNTLLQLE